MNSGYNVGDMTDVALVSAALAGDTTAFAALVERHARVCIRYATRMLGNEQDAEDAAQEAFIRAYGALARFDGSVAFRTWLMTILINRCRSALDSRRRIEDRATLLTDTIPSVSAGDSDMALRDTLNRALTRLDPQQREAFLLKHVEQLNYDEIAAMTGTGVSALKMRVQRARERLQALLKDERHD